MKKVKSILYAMLAVSLILGVPAGALARGADQQNAVGSANLKASMKQNTKPLLGKNGKENDLNPNGYPLVHNGNDIDTLIDSVGSYHYLTYKGTASYSRTQMKVDILHSNYGSSKDPYLAVEFYTNHSGTLSYLGSSSFYVGAHTGSTTLSTTLNKSAYQNDPYLYMRVGTFKSFADSYYSSVTHFKVTNPFYEGSTTRPGEANYYELISNESADGNVSENAGSFQINNDEYASSKKLSRSAYQMDYIVPFDTKKHKNKSLRKSTRSFRADYQTGDSKSFYVQNLENGIYSSMNATLLYSGTRANIWVHNNQLTSAQAALLGKEFDQKIYSSDVDNFGAPSDVDQNGKVNILCYDIQDGFNGSGGYVAGYFSPQDLYNYSYSNQSEIFYIDTYPLMGLSGTKDVSQAYTTLAHEFEHMINFNQKVFVQGLTDTDTWMDEGLAMAAEQIYTGAALGDRIDYYNEDTAITNGHSLLYWDYDGDVLANYALSYLFMAYLQKQCGQGNRIYKALIDDHHSDYQAVQNIIHKYIDPNLSFGQFMTNFRAALTLKEDSGHYGFKGDAAFDALHVKLYNGSSLRLKGGGAVVRGLSSKADFSIPADKGSDITYTLLDKGNQGTIPQAPAVKPVGDSDTVVSGTADPNVTITVTAEGNTIGTGSSNSGGNFSVRISKQKAGTKLQVYAENSNGKRSNEATVTVQDKTAPSAPKVSPVSDADTTVSGTAEAGAKITVQSGSAAIGTSTADGKGHFKVAIAKQKAGTKLTVYARDAAGNKSGAASITVIDKTAPAKPKVNTVSDAATTVTGRTESRAAVTIKRGSIKVGTGKADSKGHFKIKIAKQKAGTKLTVYAKDTAGNTSAATSLTVVDKTAPASPSVHTFGDNQTTITGKAEAGAKVTIKSGKKTVLGKATASSKGKFSVRIKSKQKAGTTLAAYATDKAGNTSSGRSFKVADKTAPGTPTAGTVTHKSTKVTGKSEKYATVYIYNGSHYIGKSTASSKGRYTIRIKKQKKGSTLKIYAKDKAGNKSKYRYVKVK
ncbi:hypothetical protein B4099_1027 [Heyndrickxia coagulans]|uniref:Bacterial Ig domain-containing protein n=1 Tax=Heyndrickxia coagulans TaxID=1398 RepID=A0A150K599_HEYCO|nr:hypothetical protein B4099_1027 [Heyndrickxia coagulans]